MTLDVNSTVWNFKSWGRPFRLVSPSLDCSSPETTPFQIECGWSYSSVLTRSGDVYAWWPFGDTLGSVYRKTVAELDLDESTKAIVPDDGTVIPCHTWEINEDPVKLPILPDLPDLQATGLPKEELKKDTKLIKIAAFDNCLVGLTNKGHVLKIDGLNSEDAVQIWHYVSEGVRVIYHLFSSRGIQLPNYSEIDKVKEHIAFRTTLGDDGQERPPQVESSDTMLITHVSPIASAIFRFRTQDSATSRSLRTSTTSLHIHPPWCSKEKLRPPQRRFQSSYRNFKIDPSFPWSLVTTTSVLSPPPGNS